MKISRRWLSNYVDLPDSTEELSRILTFSGIEVEGIQEMPALQDGIVTAYVISAEPVPGSDHLQVCMVQYNETEEPVQVVCGASNCHKGMKAVLALPGTMFGDLIIKKARLRGVESSGMLCSEKELGISDDHSGIIELDPETPIGISVNSVYELPDTVFELEITPNRPDLLGYFGIARDISASLNLELKLPPLEELPGTDTSAMPLTLDLRDAELCPRYTARKMMDVRIYTSPQWIKNALIKSGLRPINNIVDITNYVMLETGHPLHAFDYDNLKGIPGDDTPPTIIIRKAESDEQFAALDGKEYRLRTDDLVIADGQRSSALAGVIGGSQSSITSDTKRIVLEAAAFHPGAVRKTSYFHKISTDSSYRFERHLSPAMAAHVSARATALMAQICSVKIVGELMDAYPAKVMPNYLCVRPERFAKVIGYPLPEERIIAYLEKLGCKFVQYGTWQDKMLESVADIYCHHLEQEKRGETEFDTSIDCDHALWFAVPPYRVDLIREIDLIEELARLAGYHNVPVKTSASLIMDRHAYRVKRVIMDHFLAQGFFEVLNYSFTDPQQLMLLGYNEAYLHDVLLKLINPQSSNQAVMRPSLIPQLLGNLSYNLNHGERNLKLMEMSRVYLNSANGSVEPTRFTALCTGQTHDEFWKSSGASLDVFTLKGAVESLLGLLNFPADKVAPHPLPWLLNSDNLAWFKSNTPVAQIGMLSPAKADAFGIDLNTLKQDIWVIDIDVQALIEATRDAVVKFQALPRFPGVTRDLSMLVANDISWETIRNSIMTVNHKLISDVSIFDEYRGKQIPEGHRSISLHIYLLDTEKTLTDERVEQLVVSIVKTLEDTLQIKMR